MAKFTEGRGDDELLAYCMAFGIVLGAVLGILVGSIAGNGFVMAMGPVVGIFIGLGTWFLLSEQNR